MLYIPQDRLYEGERKCCYIATVFYLIYRSIFPFVSDINLYIRSPAPPGYMGFLLKVGMIDSVLSLGCLDWGVVLRYML